MHGKRYSFVGSPASCVQHNTVQPLPLGTREVLNVQRDAIITRQPVQS